MDEYFLQYLWNFQKFDTQALSLTDGATLTVFKTGHQNHNSGPDFLEAQIKIDELTWSGSIEIHHKSSDWKRHGHTDDPAYHNVILHIVWQHDTEDIKIDGKSIPTLELKNLINQSLEDTYRQYINQPDIIRCSNFLTQVPEIEKHVMLDRALAARLKQKNEQVTQILDLTGGDWEETTYKILSKSFGFKVNQDPFFRLSKSLPYQVLRKYHGKQQQIYALLFGMAGFLDAPPDQYAQELKKEFEFLKSKHDLAPTLMRHHWKNSKMRPPNFPSVRLAQFAAFIAHTHQLFANLLQISDPIEATAFMRQPLPEYWQSHYDFSKPSTKKIRLGDSSVKILIINAIVPILTAYAKYIDEVSYLEKAYSILENMRSESNHIINQWRSAGVVPKNAADSQGLIYQYSEFCKRKKCLRCNIGISILNRPIAL